jgi:Icc protein
VSKRKPRRQKRSLSQNIFIGMSLVLAASMVVSLFIVALPGPAVPTSTPWPTLTPAPLPTNTPFLPEPSPSPEPTEPPAGPALPSDTPAAEPTEPPMGPALLSDTPAAEPTEPPVGPVLPTDTPTVTPTLTVTPAGASLPFTFAVCGDSRNDPATYRKVLESVTADDSEFLIHTGDLVNKGTEARWQEFAQVMAGFTLPFYPVPGNHDGLGGALDGYLAHSGAPAPHYSFDRDPIHFTLADSHNGGITRGELTWLRDDLSATDQPVKMVFLHHPPFDPDGTDHIMAFGNNQFMNLMVEQAVDYVFAGHIHAYAQEERDGVIYTITGGAGAPLYATDHPHAFHHYLRVTVQGEDIAIEIVRI